VSYENLIESQGVKILVEESDSDYQGDSLLLVEGDGGYGLLVFGWGSCSGCDAYEAAYGDEVALQGLAEELIESIKWFPTRAEAVTYIQTGKDWEGSWVRKDTVARFKEAV
jgi:hypothetical protein